HTRTLACASVLSSEHQRTARRDALSRSLNYTCASQVLVVSVPVVLRCESGWVRGAVGSARERSGRWPDGPGGWRGFSSGGGLDRDVEAERLDLAQEPAGAVLGRVAAGEPVGAELAVGQPVLHDVVVGDEDVVADGADRLVRAAAAADLRVVGGEVGAFRARRRLRRLAEGRPQPLGAAPGLCLRS